MITNRIRVLRAHDKMTQKELGDRIGVSRNTINSIENNKSIPNLVTALKISKVFNKSVNEIFFISNGNLDLQNDDKSTA